MALGNPISVGDDSAKVVSVSPYGEGIPIVVAGTSISSTEIVVKG